MERQPLGQLQAVNLFETEEVHGLTKMPKHKKSTMGNTFSVWDDGQHRSIIPPTCIHTRPAQGCQKGAPHQTM